MTDISLIDPGAISVTTAWYKCKLAVLLPLLVEACRLQGAAYSIWVWTGSEQEQAREES